MKLLWTDAGWSDYLQWQSDDRTIFKRVNDVIKDARRSPYEGIGRPEPLRHEFSGWWSRRITEENRLVYRVVGEGDQEALEIIFCRLHYRP